MVKHLAWNNAKCFGQAKQKGEQLPLNKHSKPHLLECGVISLVERLLPIARNLEPLK